MRNASRRDGCGHTGRAVDVDASEQAPVAVGLDQPGQMDDGVGTGQRFCEIPVRRVLAARGGDVDRSPFASGIRFGLGVGHPSGESQHRGDVGRATEHVEDRCADVAGGSDDCDSHVLSPCGFGVGASGAEPFGFPSLPMETSAKEYGGHGPRKRMDRAG